MRSLLVPCHGASTTTGYCAICLQPCSLLSISLSLSMAVADCCSSEFREAVSKQPVVLNFYFGKMLFPGMVHCNALSLLYACWCALTPRNSLILWLQLAAAGACTPNV